MLTSLLDGQVMAEKHGSGAPRVLAMHGWARNRHDWAPVLRGHDAVALDLPGFGATPPPEDGWSTEDYAQHLLPLLDPAHPTVLVGHSFGGRVAVQLARLRPEAVAGLVLTGVPLLRAQLGGPAATGRRRSGPLDLRLAKALHKRGIVPESVVDRYRQKYGSADYNAAQGVMRTVLVKAVNEDYTRELQAIRAAGLSTEMVWGESDTAAPVAMARSAAELVGPTARLDVVPGSAHLLDDRLTTHLREALDRLLETKEAEA